MFEPQRSYQHAVDGKIQVFVGLGRPAKAGEWLLPANGTPYIGRAAKDCAGHDDPNLPFCEALAPVPFAPGQGQLTGWRYKIEGGEVALRMPNVGEDVLTFNGYEWRPSVWRVEMSNRFCPDKEEDKRYIMERDEPTPLRKTYTPVADIPESEKPHHGPFPLKRDNTPEAQRIWGAVDAAAAKAPPQPNYEALLRRWQEAWSKARIVGLDSKTRTEIDTLYLEGKKALNPPPPAAPCSHEHCVEISNLDRSKIQRKCESCGAKIESAHGAGRRRADWAQHTTIYRHQFSTDFGFLGYERRERTDDQRVDDKTRQENWQGRGIKHDNGVEAAHVLTFRAGYRAAKRGKGEK